MRRDDLLSLFMGASPSPDTQETATSKDCCGMAMTASVNNTSVYQLRKLASSIDMKSLTKNGTLRDDDGQRGSPDDDYEVSDYKHIYVSFHHKKKSFTPRRRSI